jgi:RimJ/RimL family protein N-acetyltransferase
MILGDDLLQSERIQLQPITTTRPDFLDRLAEWFGQDMEMLRELAPRVAYPATRQTEEEWLTQARKASDSYTFMMIERASDQVIGGGGLHALHWPSRRCELGIYIGDPSKRNQGYGAEALQILLRFAFWELNMNRVELHVFDFNARAIAAYRKVGFVEEGRQRQAFWRDGQPIDNVVMSVLRDEWTPR